MIRKGGMVVLMLLLMPMVALAQNTGTLAGVVTDAATGDPLPGANVVLEGTTVGAATDVDGEYRILGVPVGTYDIRASFVGYQSVLIENVEINSGYTRQLDFELSPGQQLDEIVVEYERPLIQNDAIGAPRVVSGEDIENLSIRGATSVAALQGGVVNNDGSSELYVRGGRDEQVSYYVDGVKVIGGINSLGVPQSAIQEQEMLIGSIPARYGDAMSGVISISTKSGRAQNFFGTLEAVTSEALDGYGYNLFSASLGGPLVSEKLSFFISGQGTLQSDANPFAIETPRLEGRMLDYTQQFPQVFQVQDAQGNYNYVGIPDDIQGGTMEEIMGQLSVDNLLYDTTDASFGEGGFDWSSAGLTGVSPYDVTEAITPDRFTYEQSKDQQNQQYDVTGSITFTPVQSVNLRVGGTFARNDQETFNYARSLYANDRFYNDEDQTWRAYGTWRQHLSDRTFFQLQVDYTDDQYWYYPNGFSRDVTDAFFYGDLGHESNQLLTRYIQPPSSETVEVDGEEVTVYSFEDVQRVTEGSLGAGAVGPGTFALPGQALGTYQQGHNQQLRFTASATTQIGPHQIEFGGEYEQRTQRFYSLAGAGLARYYADDNVEADFEGTTEFGDLPYEAFRPRATWYGYDFRGLNEVDDQDISAFTEGENYNIAPYEPIYYAGYLSDKLEFNDLVIQLGVRVDVFDNNTQVLLDPLAYAPIIRAGDEGVDLPDNNFTPGDDYAVYFAGDDVVGYHDLEGNFYDAAGNETTRSELDQLGGRPEQVPGSDAFSEDIFTDYDPEVTFMPRVGVSFPVTDQALFFASYNVTSQRPSQEAFAPFNAYEGITGQNRISNPDLRPEKTTQYELGFRQRLGARAAIQLSGFYRTQDNLIQVRDIPEAFPNGYQSFRNVDFATTKGAEVEFDLRRTNGFSARANYTFSYAQGTGSDAESLGVIAWRSSLGGYAPNFIAPTAFDRRHSINIVADYRLGEGEGPTVMGANVFENFGVNVVADVGSGMPYTRLIYDRNQPYPITENFTSNVGGGINAERLPWTSLVNLRVDRRFSLGSATSLTAFLWVENLLDTDNPLGVYRVTGLPDEDGYLDTPAGIQGVRSAADALGGDPRGSESYAFYYGEYADAPVNVGGNHYSGGRRYVLPRRMRLGLRLNF